LFAGAERPTRLNEENSKNLKCRWNKTVARDADRRDLSINLVR